MADLDPSGAARDAQRILDGDRYRGRDVPRPFEGALRWLGDRIEDVARPVADLAGTPAGLAVVLGGAVVLAAGLATLAVRRRTRLADRAEAEAGRVAPGDDPRALEVAAAAAEERGDLSLAVRLRFRAGLLGLERAGLAPTRGATTGRLLGRVPSPAFAPLARAFDEIAYGGRPARPDDVEAARTGWPRVLGDAFRDDGGGDGEPVGRAVAPRGSGR